MGRTKTLYTNPSHSTLDPLIYLHHFSRHGDTKILVIVHVNRSPHWMMLHLQWVGMTFIHPPPFTHTPAGRKSKGQRGDGVEEEGRIRGRCDCDRAALKKRVVAKEALAAVLIVNALLFPC